MNLYFIKKTLFICFYFYLFIFLKDLLFALLIRFYDPWISSFVILPTITLIILLVININRFNLTYLKETKIDFIFLFRILFLCVCLYFYSHLFYYGLLERFDLFYSKKTSNEGSFIFYFTFILAAVVEELFFRGFLLKYAMKSKVENKTINLVFFSILTSVLFSVAHMRFDLFIIQYFIFSLICSFIYIKSKNLFYTILFHSFYNIMSALYIGDFLDIKELNLFFIVFFLMFFLFLVIRQMFKLSITRPL